jgi:NADPH:quinone reductase-like Zn-dependent oxidoreductase/predicted cupin superfamily sugar epimerase
MARAVVFDRYGDVDVLRVVEQPEPELGPREVRVAVMAAAVNPGEANIRGGMFAGRFPPAFPSGQGHDLAGVVTAVGAAAARFAPGDPVLGYTTEAASHATAVVVPEANLVPKPAGVPWAVAGSLYVAGTSAYAAVRAAGAGPGDIVVVSGAAGGVGSIAVQLARRAGAAVIGLAGPANHAWLAGHGVVPVAYAEPDLSGRIRAAAPGGVDAFVDTYGHGYVELALELGVAPDRIDTIFDVAAAERYGVKAEGNMGADAPPVMAELAALVAAGELEVPVAATYLLERVRDAFRELERRHTRGKIVLVPDPVQALVSELDLAPHPEGGWYRETWRAGSHGAERPAGTAIHYLLAAGQRSHWHRVDATEIWHFYAGEPLRLAIHAGDGPTDTVTLGPDVLAGQRPQAIVPAGAWQSAEPTGAWALVGCTVSPGFTFDGFEMAPPGWSPG